MGFVSEQLQARLARIDSQLATSSSSFQLLLLDSPELQESVSKQVTHSLFRHVHSPAFSLVSSDGTSPAAFALDPFYPSTDNVTSQGRSGHSDSHIPSIDTIESTIHQCRQLLYAEETATSVSEVPPAKPDETASTLEILLLAKAALVIHAHLVEKILAQSTSIVPSMGHWLDVEGSNFSIGLYLVQTLPERLFRLVASAWAKHQRPSLAQLFTSLTSLPLSLSLFSDTTISAASHLSLSKSSRNFKSFLSSSTIGLKNYMLFAPSLLQLTRTEISKKRLALWRAHEVQAAYLGLLTNRGLNLNELSQVRVDASDKTFILQLKSHVNWSLGLMQSIMDKTQKLDHDDDMEAILMDLDVVVEVEEGTDFSTKIIYDRALAAISSLKTLEGHYAHLGRSHGRPSFVTRWWLPASLGAFAAWKLSKVLTGQVISDYITEIGLTVHSFASEWIYKPLRDIWMTIRHQEAQLALLGAESLNSDIESLERMVVDFAKDHGVASTSELQDIIGRARVGDVTVVLRRYEEELKQPLRNVVFGDLIRTLLIQVQKTKVDGEVAMTALDKLLKANELNFAFLATVPSLLLVYSVGYQLQQLWGSRMGIGRTNAYQSIRHSLRTIERILNLASSPKELSLTDDETTDIPASRLYLPYREQGLVLMEVHRLRQNTSFIPTKGQYRTMFMQDLRELESMDLAVSQRLGTINRMWRTYPFWRQTL
ncbi:ATP synthase regulation protein NCA2-domain-containing protein [Polychytrium aggregatum]|uniref:ATP synthase regulation protein NCA2-domain-containing protein n=1 Tax=Polychytrium aggregatum TaxID=110093 RepID=UPI0022FF1551|nr:ATP synthase regulation protein NCA2-domain-containing protein [Polychytrium aggregatum]KAI9207861.1 ATP synthase regulation protein NCA2-domain-containing protein [Polychytrium aggregatum]